MSPAKKVPPIDFTKFEERIGVVFSDKGILRQAFTHRSYINEHRESGLEHNERLEFLGDAILELSITDFLYHKYPEENEGELTSYRAALVNTNTISDAAKLLGMGEFLLLSKGEAKDEGKGRQYILANTFEAVIGALYLDQGYECADDFIKKTRSERGIVLIIDEAQDLTLKALEQIRLLSNLETNTDKLLQIVLVGQPELRDTLNQPSLAQLRQRVHVRFHLTALDRQEVEEYILHRLHVAGMDERANFIFTKEAIDLIYDQSRGIPRMINKLCDWAMLGAFSKKLLTIDDKVVENVAVEAEGVMC